MATANSEPTQPRRLAFLVLALGIALASTAAILIEIGHDRYGLATIVLAAGRLGVATLVLSGVVAAWPASRRALSEASRRDVVLALLAGWLLAVHFATWFASLAYTSVASSVTLVSTSPMFVALGAAWVLKERLPRIAVLGMLLAVAGSAGISLADAGLGADAGEPGASRERQPLLGNALALAGAVAMAGYLLVGRHVRQRLSLVPYIWLTYASAAVVLLLWSLAAGEGAAWTRIPAVAWWIVLGLALGPQLVGHTSLNWAVRHLPATVVAVAVLGEPIGSALLAWWLLGQPVTPLQGCSALVLLTGIGLVSRTMSAPAPAPTTTARAPLPNPATVTGKK